MTDGSVVHRRNDGALHRLFLIQLLSMGAMEMSAPFWPLHLRQLGQLSPAALAWASSIAYGGPVVMAIIFTPLWGRLGDRIGHKPMLLRALVALALTQLWISCTENTTAILAARLTQGALAGFIASAQAYGANLVAAPQRGALMSRLQIATAIGSVLGPMLGGWCYDTQGFSAVNLIAAVICVACALLAWLGLPVVTAAPRTEQLQEGNRASPVLSPLYGLLLAIVLIQIGKMMPQAFFGLFAEQVLLAPSWTTGLCYGATALGLCMAAPLWAKRFGERARNDILREVEWICWLCVGIVAIQAISRDVVLFVLARLLWGVCLAALLPVFYGLLSRQAAARHQGLVLAAGNSAAKTGALLGIAAGALALGCLPAPYLFWPVVVAYAVTAIALRLIRRKLAPDPMLNPVS
ncbi:MAG: MFS transporter [Collimonas sp.]